jgi:rRNA maturation endonuclease Nob1
MGDMGDFWRDIKQASKEHKALHAIDCPGCPKIQPKRIPTRLLPGKKCKVCGYRIPITTPTGEAS